MKVIITTTINAPTAAIRKYDAMPDWHLIVVGDRKTPEYKLDRGTYLSWEDQQKKYPKLCGLIGPDNTQRGRMIACLEAHERKAEIVASIDDDCDPLPGWPGEIYLGRTVEVDCYNCLDLVFNPFGPAGYKYPPRGFPPQFSGISNKKGKTTIVPLIQENFWHGEADYDACWRVHGSTFETCQANKPFCGDAPFSPVNTQNMLVHGSILKDWCGEIPFVGHVGDVWAGYLFQRDHPDSTVYAPANVRHWQDRTIESVLKDLNDEIYSYGHALEFLTDWKLPPQAERAIEIYRSYFD